MHFDKSDLQQLTPEYVVKLSPERVVELFEHLREDLLNAHDRLNQNPTNSSRPPSSRTPWDRESKSQDESSSTESDTNQNNSSSGSGGESTTTDPSQQKEKRKPGKQPGAQGFGRTQKFVEWEEQIHKPEVCRGCNRAFSSNVPFVATMGFETIDLILPKPGTIGLAGNCTKHIYGTCSCDCGFETTSKPYRALSEKDWSAELTEWRLIGPTLLAFIVFAKLRLHHSIGKTKELLAIWFGISLSEGVLSQALHEAGRAVSDLEPALIEALRSSNLIHIDETSWKERKVTRWLWVAISKTATYFVVGPRTVEMAKQILGTFSGWVMSDGYNAYRSFPRRVRCWAHLKRKAKGLAESWDLEAAQAGEKAISMLNMLQDCVYQMRMLQGSARSQQQEKAEELEATFLMTLLRQQNAKHVPTAQFATEILNDPQAIFEVIRNPDLPLTNNVAERALRPLVIMRKISQGAKNEEGSRIVAVLASVYETLRSRIQVVPSKLAEIFRLRRAGSPSPPLPAPSL